MRIIYDDDFWPDVPSISGVDATTAEMMQALGHACLCCPTRVRDLMATVHNFIVEYEATVGGIYDSTRLGRKLYNLKDSHQKIKEVFDKEHLPSLDEFRKE